LLSFKLNFCKAAKMTLASTVEAMTMALADLNGKKDLVALKNINGIVFLR